MDDVLTAAARALDAGDVLGALDRVALRDDAPALSMRAVALARLGKFERARELLRAAARRFGSDAPREVARCTLADAEIAFALRDLRGVEAALANALEILNHCGDHVNALHASCLAARGCLMRGRTREAEARLAALDLGRATTAIEAEVELTWVELHVRELRIGAAKSALTRAERAAKRARIPALERQASALRAAIEAPTARLLRARHERAIRVSEIEALYAEPQLMIVDARAFSLCHGEARVPLARRPVLFALARTLAEAWPRPATRPELLAQAFSVTRGNESHRARLRVEVGRLRRALRNMAQLRATADGFELVLPKGHEVAVVAPLVEGTHAAVLALLGDGEAWSSSALAIALESSQRSVQRALLDLESQGKARATGLARAKRWLLAPYEDFRAPSLLPFTLAASVDSGAT